MFNKTAAALALIVATAGATAQASQLALSLDVAPGAYSTAELIELRDAREDNDRQREAFILSGGTSGDISVETKVQAFSATSNDDGPEAASVKNFRASVVDTNSVSSSTIAFAQSHLDDVAED